MKRKPHRSGQDEDQKVVSSSIAPINYFWKTLFLTFLSIGILFSYRNVFSDPYYNLISLILLVVLAGFAFAIIISLVFQAQVHISRKEIRIKRFTKEKTYTKEQVKGFYLSEYSTKHSSGEFIEIVLENTSFNLDSNVHRNYSELKGILGRNYKRIKELPHPKRELLWSRAIAFMIGLLLLTAFVNAQLEDIENLETNLAYHEVTLSKSPMIKSTSNKSRSKYIQVFTKQYSDFNLVTDGANFQIINRAMLQAKKDAKVKIRIDQHHLEAKLLKNIEPNFKTKHINWNKIYIYGFQYNGTEYINMSKLKRSKQAGKNSSVVLLIFGLGAVVLAFVKY